MNNRFQSICLLIIFSVSPVLVNAGNVQWQTHGGGKAFGELVIILCVVVVYYLFIRPRSGKQKISDINKSTESASGSSSSSSVNRIDNSSLMSWTDPDSEEARLNRSKNIKALIIGYYLSGESINVISELASSTDEKVVSELYEFGIVDASTQCECCCDYIDLDNVLAHEEEALADVNSIRELDGSDAEIIQGVAFKGVVRYERALFHKCISDEERINGLMLLARAYEGGTTPEVYSVLDVDFENNYLKAIGYYIQAARLFDQEAILRLIILTNRLDVGVLPIESSVLIRHWLEKSIYKDDLSEYGSGEIGSTTEGILQAYYYDDSLNH